MGTIISKVGLSYLLLYAGALLGVVISPSNAPLRILLLPWSLGMESVLNHAVLLPFVILNGLAIYALAASFDQRYQEQTRHTYVFE